MYLQPNGFNIVCEDQETVDVDTQKTIVNELPGPTELDDHPGYLVMAPGDRSPMKGFFGLILWQQATQGQHQVPGRIQQGPRW